MPQYQVELICNDPRVLPELANHLKEPWSTISDELGAYYWSSSHFDAFATVGKVDECASGLLPMLNGLVKLRLTNAGELTKGGRIKYDNYQGKGTLYFLSTSMRVTYKIQSDENSERDAKQQWLNIAKKGLEENMNSPISHALNHFGKEADWHNLFNVYEVIRKDYNNSKGIINQRRFIQLPEEWTRDENGRKREKDFTESANNAYVSGITARHSIPMSDRVVQVDNSLLFRLARTGEEILPMTLDKAKIYIAGLLAQWITKREAIATNDANQAAL